MWVVGSRSAFSAHGYAPVAFTAPQKITPPEWFRDVCLLAQTAGYLHDWGKASLDFANKLAHAVTVRPGRREEAPAEPVRHEWLSYHLFRHANANGFENAWSGVSSASQIFDIDSLQNGVVDRRSALEFLIISHHRLLGRRSREAQKPPSLAIDSEGHVKGHIPPGGVRCATDAAGNTLSISETLYEKSQKLLGLASDHEDNDYWHLVALVSRACLILADHQISSIDYQKAHGKAPQNVLYANTKRVGDRHNTARFDQPLDWHLENVGNKAAEIAQRLSMTRFEGLSPVTIASILERSTHKRFAWQDQAVDFLAKHRADKSGPALVLSGAGTGAGKTRANAKIICSLSDTPRFCVALNLRSLTLQTGDSMKHDLKIPPSEIAVVVGDKIVEKMQQHSPDAFSTTQGYETEAVFSAPEYPMPQWLKQFSQNSKTTQLLMPPVLVSTIDFIINANEPGRQGHHALAMLRAMNSDLVLDELDSYEPTAMVAVLRLVQMSAMFGRNVICSSATLSVPVGRAVYEAFMRGYAMRKAACPETGEPLIAMVDDLIAPEILESSPDRDPEVFEAAITQRHARMIDCLKEKPVYRSPSIAKIEPETQAGFFATIKASIDQLHRDFQWSIGLGRSVSFGLVRIANIKTAIALSRYLSEVYGEQGVRVACYHANELRIQRHLKEKRLDFLLSRKSGDRHICNDQEVNEAFGGQPGSIAFIVVATSVEEVGRDHDFDWAVVEPSSAQSIVQTCGRVNRHRLVAVNKPNVVLLDKNLKAILRPGKPCFQRPGIEGNIPKLRYKSQSLSVLAGPQPLTRIDASFRLGDTPMAIQENAITAGKLVEGVNAICGRKGLTTAWMSQGFYLKYPLREFSKKDQYRLAPTRDPRTLEFQQFVNPDSGEWRYRSIDTLPRVSNAWLCWDEDTLVEAAQQMGIEIEDALFLELPRYSDDGLDTIVWDASFGFEVVRD